MTNKGTVFIAIGLTVLLALAGATLYGLRAHAAPQWRGVLLDNPPPMGDVVLSTTSGARAVLSDLAAPYLLVFFGYTSCPDVCPLTTARLTRAYRGVGEPERVQVVMVTVDPATGTPERLQAYVVGFHPDFLGLSGSNQEIAEAALRFYVGVNALGDGLVAHSDPVALLGPDRAMRLLYPQDKLGGLEAARSPVTAASSRGSAGGCRRGRRGRTAAGRAAPSAARGAGWRGSPWAGPPRRSPRAARRGRRRGCRR